MRGVTPSKERRGGLLGDFADSYLVAHNTGDRYPVGDAFARADRRAHASAMLPQPRWRLSCDSQLCYSRFIYR